jgi:sterol 3beta-glucosyltransferase
VARVGLQTWGSEGDVQPFLTVARALAEAGHEVRAVLTTQADEAYAVEGVSIERVGPRMTKADGDAILERCLALRSPVDQARLILREGFAPAADAMREAARDLVSWADVVVRHHFLHMTQAEAEAAGTPELSVYLTPDLIPTRRHPPTGLWNLGAPLNRLAWRVAGRTLDGVFGPPAHRLRAELGLPPRRGVLRGTWASETGSLVAVSPSVWPRPDDWPDEVHLTGFWRGPATEAATPPAVAEFLAAGAAPLFVTLGSHSPVAEPARSEVAALVVEAGRAAGRRIVLQRPAADGRRLEGDDLLEIESAPHAEVFGACAAVLHHGGAGTTQTAIRAGVPSVVLPHLADQFFWAARVEALGVGVAAPSRRAVTVQRLARALERVDGPMRDRARSLGAALDGEDGPAAARGVIEAVLQTRR